MSALPFVLVGFLVVVIAVALLIVGRRSANEVDPLAERLAEYGSQAEISANLEEIEMSVPFSERVLLPIAQGIGKFTTQFTPSETLEKTQKQIDMAGNPNNLTPPVFWVMRLAATFGLGILMLIVMTAGHKGAVLVIGATLGGAVFGFMLPQIWLSGKVSRRQGEIQKSLPDALDLMSICVNAGLGFDQAMGQVYEKWDNELALAFGRVLQELQLGKTRREALRSMDAGVGLADLTTFVGAIIQADQLGVSMTRILTIQAEQMRMKRRQRAEEKAQRAPILMMIPLAIFIFPTIYIVLLGPAVIQVFKMFFQ